MTGLFEPVHPDDDFWKQNPSLIPATMQSRDGVQFLGGSAFVDPATVGRLSGTFGEAHGLPLLPREGDRRSRVRMPNGSDRSWPPRSRPESGSSRATRSCRSTAAPQQAVETSIERGATLSALLALLAAAPLGVVLAVLVLGVQVVVRGRKTDLVLASARGASALQLRGVMALEGAMLTIPASAVIAVLATVLIPGPVSPGGFLLPALVALTPAVLFAALAVTRDGPSPIGRLLTQLRGVVEIAVVLLALVSLFLLTRRGLAQASRPSGIDPLLSVAPLLLAVSVGIVVLRGYPIPMRAARRAAARGRGLPAFVGSIRATRSPTIGLAGVLALVVGISVALFSAVLLTTFDAGITRAAAESVGADARIDAPALTAQERTAVERVDGVRAVAGILYVGPLTVTKAPINDSVTVVAVRHRGARHPAIAARRTRSGGRRADPGRRLLGPPARPRDAPHRDRRRPEGAGDRQPARRVPARADRRVGDRRRGVRVAVRHDVHARRFC